MKAKININMDNAAFTELPGHELASILRDLANKVVDSPLDNEYDRTISLRDTNGNMVGKLVVTN